MATIRCRHNPIVARALIADITWGDGCPKAPGRSKAHRGETELARAQGDVYPPKMSWDDVGDRWPTTCAYCGQARPEDRDKYYRGMSLGEPIHQLGPAQPGDVWFVKHNDYLICRWSNCSGEHLHVLLPDGVEWDVDSRAGNCTMKDDTKHRCWQRKGVPPNVTAGKDQPTCQAGAGSIQTGSYHGFLENGTLRSC